MYSSYSFSSIPVGYDVRESVVGQVLVAATARGICAVLLGDEPETLERELHGSYPQAVPAPGDPALSALARRVIRLLDGANDGQELPLDAHGSEFERRVWNAIRGIPSGSSLSYTALARLVGLQDNSARAVARACAANRIAVLIPCHRVIRADGSLAGYRWGLERKRMLLEREVRT